MSNERRAGIAKLSVIFLIVAIVLQAVFFIHPLNLAKDHIDGVCNVTNIWFVSHLCVRNSKIYNIYKVPIISGVFNKVEGRPYVPPGATFPTDNYTRTYSGLSISKKYVDTYGSNGPERGVFIYDDLSRNVELYNCSTTPYTSITNTITKYLPNLEGFFHENSYNVKSYPDTYFNCTYNNELYALENNRALLIDTRVSIYTIIPFVLSFIVLIACFAAIAQYDGDGPAKQLSLAILGMLYLALMVVNFVFYLIIRVMIFGVLLNQEPGDPEDFLKQGSVCFPVVLLVKHCIKRYKTPLPPPPEPVDTSRPVPPNTRPHVPPEPSRSATPPPRRHSSLSDSSEGHSVERRNSAPTTIPTTIPDPSLPPSYNRILQYTEGLVIPNYISDVDGDAGLVLPPPPSYDDVVNNNTYI